ncbi:MAG: TetR/AcrR family transcriptional regulator, partial [Rhodospirillales bacterium]
LKGEIAGFRLCRYLEPLNSASISRNFSPSREHGWKYMAASKKQKNRPAGAGKKRPRQKNKAEIDPAARIIDAALDLSVSLGWRSLTLAAIAKETGLEVADVRTQFPCKAAILHGLIQRIDKQALKDDVDEGSSHRDRLFDLLMRRFDALNPAKPAVAAIAWDAWCDPAAVLVAGPSLLCSMVRMLDAAGIKTRNLLGPARVKGLSLIYANAFRVWLGDDSDDMARTMAALDKGLRFAEQLERGCRGAADSKAQAA